MYYFDEKFNRREPKIRRNYEVEDKLYSKLEELTKVYEASVTDLINACLEKLVKTEDIKLYKKEENEILVTHTMLIRESNIIGLEKIKDKYGVSIYKLVNIAIKNVLNEM